MTYCKFDNWSAGTPCVVCGFRLPQAMRSRPIVPCGQIKQSPKEIARIEAIAGESAPPAVTSREPEQCRHFLCWTNRTALAICGCAAQKANGTETQIAECEKHGDVTPLARQTQEGLRSCRGCADFLAEQPANDPHNAGHDKPGHAEAEQG